MDLSKVTTKDAFDKPSDMYLIHPHFGTVINGLDNKPTTFRVHSLKSNIARDVIKECKKEGLDEEKTAERLLDVLCVGWSENLEYTEGKHLKFSEKNLKKLVSEQDWIGAQIVNHATSVKAYAPKF